MGATRSAVPSNTSPRRLDADEPTLNARVNVGNYNQFDQIVSGSIPLSDTFRIGAAVANLNHDGYGENLYTGMDNYNKGPARFPRFRRMGADVGPVLPLLLRPCGRRFQSASGSSIDPECNFRCSGSRQCVRHPCRPDGDRPECRSGRHVHYRRVDDQRELDGPEHTVPARRRNGLADRLRQSAGRRSGRSGDLHQRAVLGGIPVAL